MTFLTRKFNRYNLYYASSINSSDWIIHILCDYEHSLKDESLTYKVYKHASDEKELKQEDGTAITKVGTIKFFKDDSNIPKNAYFEISREDKTNVLLNLNYPLSQFNDIISILRYEKKPLYLFLETESFKSGLSTTEEPVEEKNIGKEKI